MANYQNQIDQIMQTLSQKLIEKQVKVTTVESCTGGGISASLTAISGSSAYIDQAFVTYSNEAKMRLVGVSKLALEEHGAVSEIVVQQMSEGGLKKANADFSIAVSGIAGPTGGTEEKPVGTVWIALATSAQTICQRFLFKGDRTQVREQTILAALQLLEKQVMNFR